MSRAYREPPAAEHVYPRTRMILSKQHVTGKEGWTDENGRESSWLACGGETVEWHVHHNQELWYDCDHPQKQEVLRILSEMIEGARIHGTLAILGDSTIALCVDQRRDCSFAEISKHLCDTHPCLRSVSLFCVSGDAHDGFVEQAKLACQWDFDTVLLIGGWNSYAMAPSRIHTLTEVIFSSFQRSLEHPSDTNPTPI